MTTPMQQTQGQAQGGQATAAGALVFHFTPAWLEQQVFEHIYPTDKVHAIELLVRICELDQKISEQVRAAKQNRAPLMPLGATRLPGLTTTALPEAQAAKPEVF